MYTYTIHTAAAQPPAAIINHHFSGRPIVTRYVSGLINGRNKNRIKLLVRSIISSIPGYILAVFVYSFMMWARVCVCVCVYFRKLLLFRWRPRPAACLYIIIILYQIGFRRVHWYSGSNFRERTAHHPLAVGGDEVYRYPATAFSFIFVTFRRDDGGERINRQANTPLCARDARVRTAGIPIGSGGKRSSAQCAVYDIDEGINGENRRVIGWPLKRNAVEKSIK